MGRGGVIFAKATTMTGLRSLTLLAIVLVATPVMASPLGRAKAKPRLKLLRTTLRTHTQLKRSNLALPLPKSNILGDKTAAAKQYADSWTCRESSRALVRTLGQKGVKLKLDSSGKKAFDWGKEGKVSYHYYAVDSTRKTTLLVDPTAGSNFKNDAKRGGMLHGLLHRAATQLGQPAAVADKIARRVRTGRDGLLVLTRTNEIDVYRSALDQAAAMISHRDAERK
jgi:hypothetical protein